MRRIGQLAALGVALMVTLPGSALGYTNGHLMDNAIMNDAGSMSEPQIQEFLTAHGTCLASYTATGFHWDGSNWHYEGIWTAAKIIFEATRQWGLSPQVIIAKLQQEESLVSGSSCDAWRYQSAMGYACPDSEACNPNYAGFSKQVLWGSYQLEFNLQRSEGHTAWDEDGSLVYSGFMLKGLFARCESCELAEFSGHAIIDGTDVYLETGATASLYSYTPHLAGGRLFDEVFEAYFGPAVTEEIKSKEPEPPVEPKGPAKAESRSLPVQMTQQAVATPNSGVSGTLPVRSQPATTLRCNVPKLKGKTLARAKMLVASAHCKVGKVSQPRRGGRKPRLTVVSQSPRAKTTLPVGAKVALRLG